MQIAEPRSNRGFFRGAWSVQGQEATCCARCACLPGGGFLACNAEDRAVSLPAFRLSAFGYSEAGWDYSYHGFSGSGSHCTLRGQVRDGVWRFHGQAEGRAPWRRWRATIVPMEQGFSFREETSDGAGPWRESAALEYIRLADGSR